MSVLSDKQGRLDYLQTETRKMFEGNTDLKFTADEAETIFKWNKEMNELGAEIDQLKRLESIGQNLGPAPRKIVQDDAPTSDDKPAQPRKDLAVRIRENEGFKAFSRNGGQGTFTINLDEEEVKTLITLTTVSPQNLRLPRIEPLPVERRTVADMMMQGTIDRGTLEYYEETTLTNAAVEVAEGSAKPEAALAWTLRTEAVSKIAVWIPATTESLEDVSWLRSTIENRLVFMVRRREEAELLNGDGTAPNISGITDRAGIQTQAKGADPTPDAILKAANLIRVNSFYEPDGLVIHPLDMQDIRLLRTADGIYIFGSPTDPYTALRMWGMEVRETTGQTQNTAIVGAFGTAAQVFRRSGITITASTEHSTYFIDNKVAILAEERLGLAVYRPNAFCTVTGI